MIIFARHGETENGKRGAFNGVSDSPLTSLGEKQALLLANFCKKNKIKKIYSSPLGRCLKTSQKAADACNLKIIVKDILREMCYGYWEGKAHSDFEKLPIWKKREKDFLNFIFPGEYKSIKGESYNSLYNRVKPFFEELVKEKEPLIIVSHAGVIRCARKYFDNIDNIEFQKSRFPNNWIYVVQKVSGEIRTEIIKL